MRYLSRFFSEVILIAFFTFFMGIWILSGLVFDYHHECERPAEVQGKNDAV